MSGWKVGDPYIDACHCGRPKHVNWRECNYCCAIELNKVTSPQLDGMIQDREFSCYADTGCTKAPDSGVLSSKQKVYLKYLRQAYDFGLPPDGRRFDVPCKRFQKAADRLLELGFAKRRWIWFGPLGITEKGLDALGRVFDFVEIR